MALMRVSSAAAFSARPPQPQMPMMPVLQGATSGCRSENQQRPEKSSVLMSGEAMQRGWPLFPR